MKLTLKEVRCWWLLYDVLCGVPAMQVNRICERGVSKIHLYRLVSVVEHFGRAGGGHYTVYRSGKAMAHKMESQDDSEASTLRWFCISDSDVSVVSENDVLAAEASLLFYERVIEG